MAESWFDTHLRVAVPAALEVNATGVCVSDSVHGGQRVTEWRSDHPVRIWNSCAGNWKVKRGDGVAIVLRPAPSLQRRRDDRGARRARGAGTASGSRRSPGASCGSVEFAGLADVRAGLARQHHVLGEHRLPDAAASPRRTPRSGSPRTSRRTSGGRTSRWRATARAAKCCREGMAHFSTILLMRAGQGARAAHGVLPGDRGPLRAHAPRRLGAAAGQGQRRAAGRRPHHLRQGRLGAVDAVPADGPRRTASPRSATTSRPTATVAITRSFRITWP